MEAELQHTSNPLLSCTSEGESMMEIELLLEDMLLYSPSQPILIPKNSPEIDHD